MIPPVIDISPVLVATGFLHFPADFSVPVPSHPGRSSGRSGRRTSRWCSPKRSPIPLFRQKTPHPCRTDRSHRRSSPDRPGTPPGSCRRNTYKRAFSPAPAPAVRNVLRKQQAVNQQPQLPIGEFPAEVKIRKDVALLQFSGLAVGHPFNSIRLSLILQAGVGQKRGIPFAIMRPCIQWVENRYSFDVKDKQHKKGNFLVHGFRYEPSQAHNRSGCMRQKRFDE